MIQGLWICSEYWRTKWNRKWISKRTMPFSVVSRDPQVKAPEKTHPGFHEGLGGLGAMEVFIHRQCHPKNPRKRVRLVVLEGPPETRAKMRKVYVRNKLCLLPM